MSSPGATSQPRPDKNSASARPPNRLDTMARTEVMHAGPNVRVEAAVASNEGLGATIPEPKSVLLSELRVARTRVWQSAETSGWASRRQLQFGENQTFRAIATFLKGNLVSLRSKLTDECGV